MVLANPIPKGRWVTVWTDCGTSSIRVWRKAMPRISERFMNSVFYLYPSREKAIKSGKGGGTGFFVALPYSEEEVRLHPRPVHLYAVSNAHVVITGNTTLRINTRDGKLKTINAPIDDWHFHWADASKTKLQCDLAVLPIKSNFVEFLSEFEVDPIPDSMLSMTRESSSRNYMIGSDIVVVGRFSAVSGREKNIPIPRAGIVSAVPDEKKRDTFRDSEGFIYKLEQEVFVAEMRSISGYSGSPVFFNDSDVQRSPHMEDDPIRKIYRRTRHNRSLGSIRDMPAMLSDLEELYNDLMRLDEADHPPSKPLLLGVDCGQILHKSPIVDQHGKPISIPSEIEHEPDIKLHHKTPTAMATIVPSWRLVELLNLTEIQEMRKSKEQEYNEKITIEDETHDDTVLSELKVGSDDDESQMFTREDFLKALRKVSRPKDESDD